METIDVYLMIVLACVFLAVLLCILYVTSRNEKEENLWALEYDQKRIDNLKIIRQKLYVESKVSDVVESSITVTVSRDIERKGDIKFNWLTPDIDKRFAFKSTSTAEIYKSGLTFSPVLSFMSQDEFKKFYDIINEPVIDNPDTKKPRVVRAISRRPR